VNLSFKNTPLITVLEACFAAQPLAFQIDNKTVLVYKKNEVKPRSATLPQQREITGRVTSDKGEPLGGVTISVKGSTVATSTNEEGAYRIVLTPESTTLVFTIVGYEDREIETGTLSVINVALQASMSDLEEVVVVGYGTQRRADVTTAVASVSAENIQNRPVQNFGE